MAKVKDIQTRISWFFVSVAYFSLFTFGFIDSARGPVFPDILKDFALTDSIGSLFFFVASTAALVNNLVLFNWMDRIGPFRTVQVYSGSQVLGLAIIGWSPNYIVTLVGAWFVGLSVGGLGIAHNLLVAEASPPRARRRLLSGLHSTYGISSLIAPLLVTWLYALHIGWRGVQAWMAVGPFLVLILSFLKKSHIIHGHESRNETHREMRPRNLAFFFAAICTCYVIAEISIGTRLALLARREWGFDVDLANQLVSLYFIGLFVGRASFAVIHFPWGNRVILVISATSSAIFYACGLIFHPAWLAASGFTLSMFYPVIIDMINDEQGPRAGYITSWCVTLQALGLMAMQLILGGISDVFGLGRALWIGPLALVIAVILLGVKPRFAPVYLGKKPI